MPKPPLLTFADYAASPDLSEDEVYTVELLIDRVRKEFDSTYWDEWTARTDERREPNYQPTFSHEHIAQAAGLLEDLEWLSFQRVSQTNRPVRDITALQYLPNLRAVILTASEVVDLDPLTSCAELEELNVAEIPAHDLSVLERLSNLRRLTLSHDQIPLLKHLAQLPTLDSLEVTGGEFDSFVGMPAMPQLRSIRGAEVKSLEGLELFPRLENITNISGEFDSLTPLSRAKHLTHIHVSGSRVDSLEHLSLLPALRDLWIATKARTLDLAPLTRPPALHEVHVRCRERVHPGLNNLLAQLSSWDTEFLASAPRHTPSLALEIVDQRTFDHYDTVEQFNLGPCDTNYELLSSERGWLENKVQEVFSVDFTEEEDYKIPFQWAGARSRTVVLLSEQAIEAFPRLVLGIQNVLCRATSDWIIYFQSCDAEPEFVVWIYPDKIITTEEYAQVIRGLIAYS